jgi:hypothetical protein
MAMCKLCEKKGIFFAVNSIGLCSKCYPIYMIETNRPKVILQESLQLMATSNNIDVVYSRFDEAIRNLNFLLPFELKGIKTIELAPSAVINTLKEDRFNIIYDAAERDWENVKKNVETLKTVKGKIARLEKFRQKIEGIKEKYEFPTSLDYIIDKSKKLEDQITNQNS